VGARRRRRVLSRADPFVYGVANVNGEQFACR
jgi:hypothetical protein